MDSRTLQPGDADKGSTDGKDEQTLEFDDPDPTEEEVKATAADDHSSDSKRNTVILVDPEQRWDFGANQALWGTVASLGVNIEKISATEAAIVSIREGSNRKIIVVLILGTQATLLSEGIQKVIQESTKQQIKTVLLPTDTPGDSEVEDFRRRLQPPRPMIIKAHNVPGAADPIGQEITTALFPPEEATQPTL